MRQLLPQAAPAWRPRLSAGRACSAAVAAALALQAQMLLARLLHRFERMRAPATNLLPGPMVERLEIAQVGRNSSMSLCEGELSNELNKKWLTCQDKASRRPRHE